MAKKRGGGGSNLGLIITLIFFILTTVILGVTTYMGYNEVDKAVEKEKAAVKTAKDRENESNWYKFQAAVCREYMGHSQAPDKDKEAAQQLLNEQRKQFESGSLSFASNAPGAAEFKAFLDKLKTPMPWRPDQTAPAATYESRLEEKDRQYAAMQKRADELDKQRQDAEELAKTNKANLDEAQKVFAAKVDELQKKAVTDHSKREALIAELRTQLDAANKDKNTQMVARADTDKKLKAEEGKHKTTQNQLSQEVEKSRGIREELSETKDKLDAFKQNPRLAVERLDEEVLDQQAREILKTWKKNWRIDSIDPKGTMPYINLGSADGLRPQVTFSVHSVTVDGRLSLTPKGTVEVIQVIGPRLSRVRVTSIKDPKADPIMKGDRLFNPTWDPLQPQRVAIAGLADMGGDGTESSEDLRRLLARQSVVVDAFIDTRNDKAPELKGQVTPKTTYLILADSLDGVKSDRSRDSDYTKKFNLLMDQMKDKAKANSATKIITLRRYLEMIGYKAPRVASSALGQGR
jgi:hypothetical protein